MEELKVYIPPVMLEFKNNKILQKQLRKFSSVYGQSVITNYQVRNCFSKFCSVDTSLKDDPRPGYSSDFDQDALTELMEYIPYKGPWEFVLGRNTSQSAVTWRR